LTLIYLDLLQAFEASTGSEATLRERQLIEALADKLDAYERDIYLLREQLRTRPEVAR
jgi:hypothetical protein